MSSYSTTGLGSTLDVNSIVSQLMTVEQRPLAKLATKEASYQSQLSAFGVLRSTLAGFRDASSALSDAKTFAGWRAASGDSTLFTATAASGASTGAHTVEVTSLAAAQRLKSNTFATTATTLGSGTLTIEFGAYAAGTFTANADKATKTISIAAGSQSLAGVRDAINAANAGVTASIVNDGTGNRLVLASRDSGAANAMRITVADADGNNTDATGLSALAYDASTGGTANLAQAVAAADAQAIIDGISVSKPSNVISDALEGVTLTLVKANPGTSASLNVTRDSSAATTAIGKFVDAYNEVAKTFSQIGSYDSSTKQAGVLQGDAAVRGIQSQLRTTMSTALATAGGGFTSLTQVGITFAKDGKLSLDSAKLTAALNDTSKSVASLFASIAMPSDSLVKFVSATSTATQGQPALVVNQLATHGAATGDTAAGTTITAGVNDSLMLSVDGNSITVKLAAGSYTAAGLAAALQSRINGGLAAGSALVTVTQAAGLLKVESNLYGAGSKVAIQGGNASAGLFGTATSVDGVDAAGTIGGSTATGNGQALTANGLTVRVEGGATGDRGTIAFARGFGARLTSALDAILASDGAIAARTNGIDKSIKDLSNRRDAMNLRLTEMEKRYRAQFTALDALMSSMNQTSNFLTQQIASLPGAANTGK